MDWIAMAEDLSAVRGDNEVSITIRRGVTTLIAQPVRIARLGQRGAELAGSVANQTEQAVVVLGSTTFNVRIGDRFTHQSALYEVTAVRPNRMAAIIAEAKLIQ